MNIIAMDAHKHYSQICIHDEGGRMVCERRIDHHPDSIKSFLGHYPDGSPVAVETVGNWYWIVDEIEAAGMKPKLVHAHKAKLMGGSVNKTDKLDARGLNKLQRAKPARECHFERRPRQRAESRNLRQTMLAQRAVQASAGIVDLSASLVSLAPVEMTEDGGDALSAPAVGRGSREDSAYRKADEEGFRRQRSNPASDGHTWDRFYPGGGDSQ